MPAGAAGSGAGWFGRFGVTERTLREALAAAMSRGGDFADLFFQHRVETDLALEDGAVNRGFASVELGVGVRVVRGGQTGYGYTEDLSLPAILAAARTAAAIADGASRDGPAVLHLAPRAGGRYPALAPGEGEGAAARLPVLEAVNARLLAADPSVRKVNVHLHEEQGAVLIADSTGRVVEDLQPMALLSASILAERDGRREQNGYNVAGRAGGEFYSADRIDRLVREAWARTAILFEAGQPPAGEMPVVLAAGSSGILLHEAIGHGMEADFNRKGTSIYADKMGKRIAQPFVSIVDDGTEPGARGSIHVDDEGNPAGRTVLVEDGVLASYLHDAISARHYGVSPTGNGRRESYHSPPLPRMRSTSMLPGPHGADEIIRSVKRGIYCQTFSNGQVQIGAGDFTFFVKNGWLIEDGKLTRPIKDVNLIGNGPRALEMVDMVGNDLAIDEGGWTCGKDGQSVPVSQGLPTVRVSSMTVGGRGTP